MKPIISSDHGTTILTPIREIDPHISINDEIIRERNPDLLANYKNNRVEKHPDDLPNHENVRGKSPAKLENYEKSRAKKGPAFSLNSEFVRVGNPDI